MKPDFQDGISPDVLAKIRRLKNEVEGMETKSLYCPYCNHRAFVVFQDARGHIQTRCKKCGQEAIFNVVFRISNNCYCSSHPSCYTS